MPFVFDDLNLHTRQMMAWEVDRDRAAGGGQVVPSSRLTPYGCVYWEALLRKAIDTGDESTLTDELGSPGGLYIATVDSRPSKTGKPVKVRHDAGAVLAQSEFNRMYIRALCVQAIRDGKAVEVYRARSSSNPDLASEAKIGTRPDPGSLLKDLRSSVGLATALGLPAHPNSGLSIRLV